MVRIDQAELTRLISQRPQQFGWFLGAGASRTAGLPTATDVIWDLKRRYYQSEEGQDVSPQDIQNLAVKERIQSFVEARGFPEQWAENEYSDYFDKIFGTDKERQRQYLQAILSEERVTLSVGNRVLGAMMAGGLCRLAFTTNFDTVVEKAMAEVSGNSLSPYHLEGAHNAKSALDNEEYPFYCKLHGDFRFDSIKNLSADLATQNAALSDCLVNAGNRFGFIVVGYSGRDKSVMELFHRVLVSSNPFPHGLYWTGIKGAPIPPAVEALLQEAEKKKIKSGYVEIETFDAFMLRLWRNLDGKPQGFDAKVRKFAAASVSIPLPAVGNGKPLVRLNALPISLPSQCMALDLKRPVHWGELRQKQSEANGNLICTKDAKVWCWGIETHVRTAFGENLVSITPQPIPTDFVTTGALHVQAFMEEALCRALAKDKPLIPRKMRYATWLIANPNAETAPLLAGLNDIVERISGTVDGLFSPITEDFPQVQQVTWAEGVRIALDIRDGKAWLLIEPDVWIWPTHARKIAGDFLDERRGDRYNKKYNELLNVWIPILLGHDAEEETIILSAFNEGCAIKNPAFEIGTHTAYTRKQVA